MPHRKPDIEATEPEPSSSRSSKANLEATEHTEHAYASRRASQTSQPRQASVAAKIRNPLAGLNEEQVIADVDAWCAEKGLQEHQVVFRKGALIARVGQRDDGFEYVSQLDAEEKSILRYEVTHRWSQPFMLYFLVVLCAGSAIVQGMDQTAVNGAQQFYFEEFGIEDVWLQGLLNGAPYLCSALIGCWSNAPLNYYFGRRGTIFISCIISFITGIWMAAANNWPNLLVSRLFLGFAIGAKSSTTPVYAAESAPKTIRGALTMMWQMWTAFGIMLGFVVYFCPESPRWYMEKGKFDKAFHSLCRLRKHKIQAARDITSIFEQAGFSRSEALLTSMGTGVTNWLFAIPAIYTIDTFGRRNLLLTTFPLMSFTLLWCGMSFYLPLNPETGRPSTERLGSIAAAIYSFMVVYSPGEGPVPFTYSAEAFPLHLRDLGMSFATATCWGFNFILSLTWPALVEAFTPQGAFGWYAAWNIFGWIYCYFLLPETKNLTLEELDTVFDVGNREIATYYSRKLPWYMHKYVLRKELEPMEPLFQFHVESSSSRHIDEGMDAKEGTQSGEKDVAARG
ncbi:hypothetical protein N0V83_002313 [Neocucurbitaria cava]|uniref:Major facilitator superfamily (MFS) profile domain-containing protein n=1 Tax=Neocucurbitaria cava TaxID=798079 RepID=A0A9W8YH90_9PLEO|nr:hypothetical protein N0V83_002313 [Neocucurbitaria cava]